MAKQSYTVKVDIHDLQDLKWTSSTDPLKVKAELPNPFVEVSVNGEVQCTQSKQNTASCSFNLTCMFRDVSLTKEQFAQSGIEVRALHKTFFSSEVIGTYFFSYESIYKRKQKSLVRQWVALTLPDRPSEPKGFARLSIAVIKSNEPMPVFDDQDADFEDLSGATSKSLMDRVMTTPELKMNYYHVLINIYKGEDFGDFSGKGSCSCGIVVRFLGVEMETVTQRDNPNPVWNVTMKLPAVVPCMESNVRLELWDFSKRPQLIDAVPLDFNEILKNGLPLQWVNFYWQPPAEGLVQQVMALADSSQKLATAYAGRLLISGSAQKAADPKPLTVSCKTQPFPPLREYRVWIDIYEISAIGQPDEVELEVCLGPLSFPLEPLRKNKSKGGGSGYVFRGDEGRLQEFRAYLPDPEMSPDLLITVRTREGWMGNRTLHSFLRVPFSRLLASVGVRPHWHNLRRVRQDDKKSQKSAAGKLLATLAAKLVGDVGDKREQRPDRAEYKLSRFLCRAFVFQASHLPVSDPHGLSDPFVRVTLAGETAETRQVKFCLVPCWWEALEFELSLPEDLALAPDVHVEVFDDDWTLTQDPELLGEFRVPVRKIPKEREEEPSWWDLFCDRFPDSRARLLASFELVPIKDADAHPFFPDIFPSTRRSTVNFFLLGIRLLGGGSSSMKPIVEIAYDRCEDDPNEPLELVESDEPLPGGGNGNFNYLESLDMNLNLPKKPNFQSYLEVSVIGATSLGETKLGHSYIHLNPYMPWLSQELRRELGDDFGFLTHQQRRERDERQRLVEEAIGGLQTETTAETTVGDASPLGGDTLDVLEAEAATEAKMAADPSLEIPRDAASLNCHSFHKDFFEAVYAGEKPPAIELDPRLSKMLEGFEWKVELPEAQKEESAEIPVSLEKDTDMRDLPYDVVPIFKGNANGEAETVGYLKYLCRIFTSKMNRDDSEIDELADRVEAAQKLVLRAYILSAHSLVPRSGSTRPNPFVAVRCGKDRSDCPTSLYDSNNYKHSTLNPDFYRCYQMDLSLPENALLHLSVMSKGATGLTDDLIGKTVLDLEDRFFHPRFQALMKKPRGIPIEMRQLLNDPSPMNHGVIRGWYEVWTPDEAAKNPMENLSTPEPEMFQLRVVIWRTRNVPLGEESTVSIFVRGLHSLDDESIPPITQETDTHWHSTDGSATFNWRFIFDLKVPCQFPTLTLQVWNYNLIQTNDAVSECSIDLAGDLMKGKKKRQRVNLGRSWIRMTHPSFPGEERGEVDVEISIVPMAVAANAPVGKGREEPNRDPALPEVTENRNYLASMPVTKQLQDFSADMQSQTKNVFWFAVTFFILFAIGFLLVYKWLR